MKIHYQCSNCGQKFQTSAMIGVPDGMYISGCRAVGDAFYCEECVKTWADRNGKPFDEQYAMPIQACNLCKTFYPLAYTGGGHRFCPNCGARMKGADDE